MHYTDFIDNVLYYISGFVVAKLIRHIKCEFWKQCLLGQLSRNRSDHMYCPGYYDNAPAAFTLIISNGGLTIPSVSTFRSVECAEKVFKLNVCKERHNNSTGKKIYGKA